ncbi:MAG: YbaB/EbfC family nucleoid-associated protein [Candidatus Omnitrophica bacterium]|nr:YbaB/EbfC family nucleoid-associated protein [Candidatus Omnitrophota bacterium]
MFDKMKQLFEMQKSMQELKRKLEEANFDILSGNGMVKISMNAAQKMNSVTINGSLTEIDKSVLEKSICDAYDRALKHAQEIAAGKLKDISGLNPPKP